MKQTIGVVGYGYVGKVLVNFFSNHFQVIVFDPAYSTHNQHISDNVSFAPNLEHLSEVDLVVISVPTNMRDDGACDLSIIEETLSTLKNKLILIKSTVLPGTTKKLEAATGKDIAFSPEYIGESSYNMPWWKGYPHPTDMTKHFFHIFGGRPEVTSRIIPFFQRVSGPDCEYWQTDSTTAELVKYTENIFGAYKVTFCNELAKICEHLGINYNELRELWLRDGRTDRMYTAVFPEKRGFSGKCLVAGTKIRLADGSFINIESLQKGDMVSNGEGSVMVTKVGTRNVDEIIRIKAGGREICGSRDHLQPVNTTVDDGLINKELQYININYDSVFVPKPQNSKNKLFNIGKKHNNYIKWWVENVEIDKDWARLIGLYLAEGCSSEKETIVWSFGEKEKYLANEVGKILTKKGLTFNKKLQINNGTFGESRCWVVRCRSVGLHEMFKKLDLGKNAHDKNCPILDNSLIPSLVGGWLDGDGCIHNGTISGVSASKELINAIDAMLLAVGICGNISRHSKNAYRIRISTKDDVEQICKWTKRLKFKGENYKRKKSYASPTVRLFKNGWLVKISSIESLPGETVYPIETDRHLYIANNILTHNCWPKDLRALITMLDENGYSSDLLKMTWNRNLDFVLESGKEIHSDPWWADYKERYTIS